MENKRVIHLWESQHHQDSFIPENDLSQLHIMYTPVEIIIEFQTLIFYYYFFYGTEKTKLFVSQLMHLINLGVLNDRL